MASSINEAVAQSLMGARVARGLSQARAAAQAAQAGAPQVSAHVVGQLERGARSWVTLPDLLALALALDVSPVDLIAGNGPVQVTDTVIATPEELRRWFAGKPLKGGA